MNKSVGFKCALSLLISLSLVTQMTYAATDSFDWGVVKLKGSVVTSTCTIDMKNKDQTVNVGKLSSQKIPLDGKSGKNALNIDLVNCILKVPFEDTVQKHFQVAMGTTNIVAKDSVAISASEIMTASVINKAYTKQDLNNKRAFIENYSLTLFENGSSFPHVNSKTLRISFIYF